MNKQYEVHVLRTVSGVYINYCYIIVDICSSTALIVDPSWDLEQILTRLSLLKVRLKGIALTHSHYDHINLVQPLIHMYDVSVYISAKEIQYFGYSCPNAVPLHHGSVIVLGSTLLNCVHTPGHTPGGMSFRLPDCLFTGDTLFSEGCGVCSERGGSAEIMFDTLQRIKRELPPDVRIYPGHSYGIAPGKTLAEIMEINIYLQFEKMEHFIDFRMRKNQNDLLNFQ